MTDNRAFSLLVACGMAVGLALAAAFVWMFGQSGWLASIALSAVLAVCAGANIIRRVRTATRDR